MDERSIHKDVLKALSMSPKGLERWFKRIESFCSKNGGSRYYEEILELVKEYQFVLEKDCQTKKETDAL